MSSKGKKKQGKVMSLSEFHASTEGPSGPATGSVGGPTGGSQAPSYVRINWADEMEKLDDSGPNEFVFDRSKLPTAAKAALQPDFDLEQVPKQPPFTAFISNVSFEADEAKIRAFFRESSILTVRLPVDERGRFKGQGFIDFADRESLITALQKNEQAFFNRPMKVALESKSKQQTYGSYGMSNTGDKASDESDWRRPPPSSSSTLESREFTGPLKSQSFHNDSVRSVGGRYGNRESGSSYQRRNNYNNQGQQANAWSHGNNRESYQNDGQRQRRSNYSKYDGPKNRNEQSREITESNEHSTSAITDSSEGTQVVQNVRPKLNLAPRTLPVTNESNDALAAASSIFGSARPVNTAAREREIEEKLQRERELAAAAKIAGESGVAEATEAQGNDDDDQEEPTNNEPVSSPPTETEIISNRSHKTSVSSDHRGADTSGEFQTVGGDRHHQQATTHGTHHGNKNRSGGGDRRTYKSNEGASSVRNQQKLASSESFSGAGNYHTRQQHSHQYKPRGENAISHHHQQHHHHQERGGGVQHNRSHDETLPAPPRSENPWKNKQSAAELFSNSTGAATGDSPLQNRTRNSESQGHVSGVNTADAPASSNSATAPPYQRRQINASSVIRKQENNRPRSDNRRPGGGYNSRGGNPSNKQMTSRQSSGSTDKSSSYQPRSQRTDFITAASSLSSSKPQQPEPGFNNKFAHLKLDVEDVDDEDDGDEVEDDDDEENDIENDDQEEQHRKQPVEA